MSIWSTVSGMFGGGSAPASAPAPLTSSALPASHPSSIQANNPLMSPVVNPGGPFDTTPTQGSTAPQFSPNLPQEEGFDFGGFALGQLDALPQSSAPAGIAPRGGGSPATGLLDNYYNSLASQINPVPSSPSGLLTMPRFNLRN